MTNWIIKLFGGYTSAEYETQKARLEQAKKALENLKRDFFVIAMDGVKVWIA